MWCYRENYKNDNTVEMGETYVITAVTVISR